MRGAAARVDPGRGAARRRPVAADAGAVSTAKRLASFAPLDDGNDMKAVADRLLDATTDLLDRCLALHTFDLAWDRPAEPRHRRKFGSADRLAFQGHVGARRSGHVLAVSCCERDGCGAFGLWQDDGVIWICCTPQVEAFSTWLRHTTADLPGRALPGAPRR